MLGASALPCRRPWPRVGGRPDEKKKFIPQSQSRSLDIGMHGARRTRGGPGISDRRRYGPSVVPDRVDRCGNSTDARRTARRPFWSSPGQQGPLRSGHRHSPDPLRAPSARIRRGSRHPAETFATTAPRLPPGLATYGLTGRENGCSISARRTLAPRKQSSPGTRSLAPGRDRSVETFCNKPTVEVSRGPATAVMSPRPSPACDRRSCGGGKILVLVSKCSGPLQPEHSR